MNSAQPHHTRILPFREQTGPGPETLPGIEGFYVLSARGRLGRYDDTGRFTEDPALTEALADRIDALLRRYRVGDVDGLLIGLVSPSTGEEPWRSATLTFADSALREVFKTGNDPRAPLTAFQGRNKVKSVYQGMELALDAHKTSQPRLPRFCPVLFAPDVDTGTLGRRYGVEVVNGGRVLEVLDLLGISASRGRQQPAISGMLAAMRRDGIAPERRRPSRLMLVEESESSGCEQDAPSAGNTLTGPWTDQPEDRDTCFNDGDPVTYWLLAWFSPFNELNDLQRQFVARGHTIVKKPAGATLIELGSRDDVSIYLIEGTLELKAFDGRSMTVVGGTRRAHLPISQLRPHAYTVTAATDVTLILFGQDMVRQITRFTTTYKSRPGIDVNEEPALPGNTVELAGASGVSR